MAKRKVTIYLDPEIARATRVHATRTDQSDSQVIETALRRRLGFGVLEQAQEKWALDEDEAMRVAVQQVRAYRQERRQG